MINWADAVDLEQSRENALQNFAIGQHVGDTAGDAQIVFENSKAAVGQSHQVGAADADVDAARDRQAAHLATKMFAAEDQFARHNAIGQNAALMVDVLQKKIERGDALGESALNDMPFIAGNDSRQKIVGENALSSLLVSVNGERNSLVKKRQVRRLLAFSQFFRRQFQQRTEEGLIMRARNTRRGEHFIVGIG